MREKLDMGAYGHQTTGKFWNGAERMSCKMIASGSREAEKVDMGRRVLRGLLQKEESEPRD